MPLVMPNWGRHPDKMAAALYFNRKRKRQAIDSESPVLATYDLTVGNDGTYWGFKDSTFGSITPGTFEGHTILVLETNPATDDVALQFDTYPGYDESIIINETYILPYFSGTIYNGVHTALSDLIAAGGTIEITLRGQ